MTTPFDAPLDPKSDIKDYVFDFTDWLDDVGDTIDSFTVTISTTAVAGGLEKEGVDVLDGTAKFITTFFKVNAANEEDDDYAFPGQCFCINATITTVGLRTKSEEFTLTVSRQAGCDE